MTFTHITVFYSHIAHSTVFYSHIAHSTLDNVLQDKNVYLNTTIKMYISTQDIQAANPIQCSK